MVVVTPSPLVVPAVATRTQGIGVCSVVLSHVGEALCAGGQWVLIPLTSPGKTEPLTAVNLLYLC